MNLMRLLPLILYPSLLSPDNNCYAPELIQIYIRITDTHCVIV